MRFIISPKRAALAAAAVFMAFVVLYRVTDFSIYGDEKFDIYGAKVFAQSPFFDSYDHPALVFALESLFINRISGTVLDARFVSVLFTLLLLASSYALLPRSFDKNRRAAFVLTMGALPLVVWLSKLAYLETPAMFFIFASFLLLLKHMETGKNAFAFAAAALLAMGSFAKLSIMPFIAYYVVIMAAYKFRLDRGGGKFSVVMKNKSPFFMFLVIGVSGLAVLALVDSTVNFPMSFSRHFSVWKNVPVAMEQNVYGLGTRDYVGHNINIVSGLLLYIIPFAGLLAMGRIDLKNKANQLALGAVALYWVFLTFSSWGAVHLLGVFLPFIFFIVYNKPGNERFARLIVPIYALLGALYFVAGMNVPLVADMVTGDIYHRPAWPDIEVANYINRNTIPGDNVLVPWKLVAYVDAVGLRRTYEVQYLDERNRTQITNVYYIYPPAGTKYIVTGDPYATQQEEDKYLPLLFRNFELVKTVNSTDNSKVYYYIFRVQPGQTSAQVPAVREQILHYSFADVLLGKKKYEELHG